MTAQYTPKERMRRALLREPVDRLPVQTNYTSAMGQRLAHHLRVSIEELPAKLDQHLLRVNIAHTKRASDDGSFDYDWWGVGWGAQTEGYWHALAPLAESEDLDAFAWPDPTEPQLMSDAERVIAADGGRHFIAPNFGVCLFERAWALRGFTPFLIDLMLRPKWVEDMLERITEIQITLARRFLALGMDGGYFGDNYGTQRGMLFSPKIWRDLFKPRLARLFSVFRDAGLPVILHSDGDIWPILPDLIEIGVTVLNPVATEVMEHKRLFREYGRHLAFYGGISTQSVLHSGTPRHVQEATLACIRNLAPDGTGLVLGPTHRMQSDIPMDNIDAMLHAFPK